MAITRSQIARQLLAGGGLSLEDAKMMAPRGEFLAYINPREAQMLKDAGGSGAMTPMGIPSFFDDTSYGEDMGASYSSYSDTPGDQGGGTSPSSDDGFGGGDENYRPTYSQQLTNLQTQGDDNFERDLAIATRTGRGGIIDFLSDNPVTNYIRDNRKGILQNIIGTALLGPAYPMLSLGLAGVGKLRSSNLIDDTDDGGGIKDKFKDTLDRFKQLGDPNKYLADLTKKQKQMLQGPQRNLRDIMGISDEEILKNISPFNDPKAPATLEDVQNFYRV